MSEELKSRQEGSNYKVDKLELVRAALAAGKEGNMKEQARLWMEASRLHLKNEFDIDDLTTIEGTLLRHITEQVVKEQMEQESKRDRLEKGGDIHGAYEANLATYDDLDDEIVERWLIELYDVKLDQIPGKIDRPFKEYLHRLRENAHKP